MTSVEQRIEEVLRDAGAEGWVHACPLGSGERDIGLRSDEDVVMASVYKLPLLVALVRMFDSGELDPRSVLRVDPASCTPGPTGLSTFRDPVSLSWRDLAASMVAVSDNAAADVILSRVGLDRVQELLAELELPRTRIVGGTADAHAALVRDTGAASTAEAFEMLGTNDEARGVTAYDAAHTSATTPREMTRLLGLIWSDAVASAEQCAFVRDLLQGQVWQHRVRSGFPWRGVRVAGKTGTIGAVRNEVGVVEFWGETPVAVAMFTLAARADLALPGVDAAIGECARLAVTDLRSGRL